MPDLWMDVDTALGEVPVNIMPLLDDTDFKTRETAVAFDAAGMDLVWNFVTTAGAMTQTAVTPTSAGNYDWANQGDGMYSIEIPASGGASINNDTEGFGWFTGVATGVLPWRGPVIGFRAAGLNDALIDNAYSTTRGLTGTALPAVAAEAAGGLYTRGSGAGQINQSANGQIDVNAERLNNVAQSLLDLKDFADDGYDPATNKVQGVVLTDTLTTYTGNTPQTGDSFARLGAPAGASVSADIAAIKAVVDAILVDTGTTLDAKIDAISLLVTSLDGRTPAALVGGRMDASVGAMAANTLTASALAADAATEIAAAVLARALAAKWGGLTVEQALGVIAASQAGKTSGAGTGTFTIRDLIDGSDVIVATTVGGNRTAVTITP